MVDVQVIGALGIAATSTVADTARHALAILAYYSTQHPAEVANVLQLQTSYGNETINTTDTLSCIYTIRAYEGVAMAEASAVPEQTADAAYIKLTRFIVDPRLRVQMEVSNLPEPQVVCGTI